MDKEKGLQGPQLQCCPWHHHPHSQWGSSWDCSLPSNIIPAVVGAQSRRGTWGLPGENSIVPAERGSSYSTLDKPAPLSGPSVNIYKTEA